jgi:hypothetical protein
MIRLLTALIGFAFNAQTFALSCESTQTRHAEWLTSVATSRDWFSRLTMPAAADAAAGEVYGQREYRHVLPNGWIFKLIAQPHGWALRLYDKDPARGGVDMTSITPPFAGHTPNPRDVSGWHFRNRDNSGPNTGDVNAPQHLRLFTFSTGLIGTGGFKPEPATVEHEPRYAVPAGEGRGWLQVEDMGITDLDPGERARLTYLKFRGCVSWPKTEEEISDARNRSSLEFIAEEKELFGSCGLDLSKYHLAARVAPRSLGGDVDGDGVLDEYVQVHTRAGDERDVLLCRAGTWSDLLSIVNRTRDFRHALTALERWRLVPADFAVAGVPGGSTVWPDADGDVLALERIEKSMHLVYWRDGKLRVERVYRVVEP